MLIILTCSWASWIAKDAAHVCSRRHIEGAAGCRLTIQCYGAQLRWKGWPSIYLDSQPILSTLQVGGNQSTWRKATTFGRALTNSSHMSEPRIDLRGERRLPCRLRHQSPRKTERHLFNKTILKCLSYVSYARQWFLNSNVAVLLVEKNVYCEMTWKENSLY